MTRSTKTSVQFAVAGRFTATYNAVVSDTSRCVADRFRRRPLIIGALTMLPLLIIADQRGWLATRPVDDMAAYHGRRASVLRVIDGDTLEVDLPDQLHQRSATRVALWGLNCPEPARAGRPSEPFSSDATALTTSLCANASVILWLESHRTRDGLGRVLAHVELPDGARLNERLLSAGLAKLDERWPHTMLTRYAQLEFSARRKAVGMWTRHKPQSP